MEGVVAYLPGPPDYGLFHIMMDTKSFGCIVHHTPRYHIYIYEALFRAHYYHIMLNYLFSFTTPGLDGGSCCISPWASRLRFISYNDGHLILWVHSASYALVSHLYLWSTFQSPLLSNYVDLLSITTPGSNGGSCCISPWASRLQLYFLVWCMADPLDA